MIEHFDRPRGARGILPLILGALSAGRAIYGAINANQVKQRNKGYIMQSYRDASQRLDTRQAATRQSEAESANARGLAQGGGVGTSPIHTAMVDGIMKAQGSPTTLGGQIQSDAGVQMGLERKDLDQQRDRALTENKDEYTNALIQSAVNGVNGVASAATMNAGAPASDVAGGASLPAAPAPGAPIPGLPAPSLMKQGLDDRGSLHAAMLSATSYRGVNPIDPLGEPTSAWSTHQPRQISGDGMTNSQFNVG